MFYFFYSFIRHTGCLTLVVGSMKNLCVVGVDVDGMVGMSAVIATRTFIDDYMCGDLTDLE